MKRRRRRMKEAGRDQRTIAAAAAAAHPPFHGQRWRTFTPALSPGVCASAGRVAARWVFEDSTRLLGLPPHGKCPLVFVCGVCRLRRSYVFFAAVSFPSASNIGVMLR